MKGLFRLLRERASIRMNGESRGTKRSLVDGTTLLRGPPFSLSLYCSPEKAMRKGSPSREGEAYARHFAAAFLDFSPSFRFGRGAITQLGR